LRVKHTLGNHHKTSKRRMKKKFSVSVNKKIEKFNKKIKIPGDKSCSIRALVFASQCIGESKITNLLESEDVLDCVRALKKLGVKIVKNKKIYKVYGNGLGSFRANKKIKIFVGNSGTTARLLTGLLATHPGKFYLHADQSMNKRDMSRVFKPLEKIGAFFYPKNKKTLPITIEGTTMPLAQTHVENLGSAQVKSSLLAAFLNTPGRSTIIEKKVSRNHTEILLKKISADIKIKKLKKGNLISLKGQKNLHAFNYSVGNDPSSSAFLIVLTLLTPKSKLTLPRVICNDARVGFIQILKKMNANIKIKDLKRDSNSGELLGTIVAYSSKLKPITVSENVAKFIDELPLLFICAALQNGVSKFFNCQELIHKESNRLLEVKKILIQAGIKCKITQKGSMTIYGKEKIKSQNKSILVNCDFDHRINMLACIYALATGIKTKIKNFETHTSFPGFIPLVRSLGGKIAIK